MLTGDHSVMETRKRYDREFHQSLIMACGSRTLLETHGSIFDKYLRYQMITLTFRGNIAAREHKELLEAALSRDASRAQSVLRRHIEGGVANSEAAETLSRLTESSEANISRRRQPR